MKLIFIIYATSLLLGVLNLQETLEGPNINTFSNSNEVKNVEIGYSSSDYGGDGDGFSGGYDNSRCMDNNKISYEFCNSKRNCNICSMSFTCGWCVRQSRCVPVTTQKVSLCDENCGGVAQPDQCHLLYIRKYFEQYEDVSPSYL
jgi:hypothetical protein